MQMVGRGEETLPLVYLQFPRFIADSSALAANLADGRDIAICETIKKQQAVGIRHH